MHHLGAIRRPSAKCVEALWKQRASRLVFKAETSCRRRVLASEGAGFPATSRVDRTAAHHSVLFQMRSDELAAIVTAR